MKVIDVLKDTCTFLQLEEELKYLKSFNENDNVFELENVLEETKNNIDLLVKCFNLVLNTVCTEYVKLKDSTLVSTNNKRIAYNKITNNKICNILCVEDESGQGVVFADYGGEIVLYMDGKYKVTYTYCLNDVEIDESVNEINLPAKCIAYGVASEYLYINKLYDDANIWDVRFKNSLLNLLSNKKHLYLKPRRWF